MSYRQSRTPDKLQARTNTTMRSFNRAVVIFAATATLLAASPFRSAAIQPPITSTSW